jgi:putative DNA primase/helicase
MKHRFGSVPYAREELRAEMASAFLTSMIGISENVDQSAAYLRNWIQALQEDKYEIFRASSDAQKIADYLIAFADSKAEAAA